MKTMHNFSSLLIKTAFACLILLCHSRQGAQFAFAMIDDNLNAAAPWMHDRILRDQELPEDPLLELTKLQRRKLHSRQNAAKIRELQSKTGQLNVLVLLLRWSNHVGRSLPDVELIRNMWNAEGTASEWGPTGSVANWTNANSFGKLQLEATVIDWMTTDNTEAHYAAGRSGLPSNAASDVIDIENAFHPLLDELDNQDFDFTKFDQDSDGKIDILVVLHSGYAGEEADVACDGAARLDRISSFQSSPDFVDIWQSSQSVPIQLGSFAIASAIRNQGCNFNIARLGTMTHEMMHAFGLIDTYDTDGPAMPGNVGGIAGYDIMANTGGQKFNKARCGFLSAYSKLEMGWLTPTEITADGIYQLRPAELFEDAYIISAPYPAGEFLLIELRRPISFDEFFWDDGGIVIFHVDETLPNPGKNGQRGYPGQQDSDSGLFWPQNGNHYRVAVVQADGEFELEKAINNGHTEDVWIAGRELKPGNGELVASSAGTYPNTDSYASGNIQVTGVTIKNFQDLDDGSGGMSFEVIGLSTGAPTGLPTISGSPTSPGDTRAPTPAPVAPSAMPVDGQSPSMSAAPTTPTGPDATSTSAPTSDNSSASGYVAGLSVGLSTMLIVALLSANGIHAV